MTRWELNRVTSVKLPIFCTMKKIKDFFRQYREDGEADIEISIDLWHVFIFIGLVAYAIYVFS